ncbi:MAG: acyl carrier protein [Planctomycetota bacterium]|nr:acyl carrier protein [Planctomycetota bacterium]
MTQSVSDQELQQSVRKFIVENFLFGQENPSIKSDTSLLEKGVIDSTGVLELVSMIEAKHKIKVDDNELVPDNFDSIARLTQYIRRKQGA